MENDSVSEIPKTISLEGIQPHIYSNSELLGIGLGRVAKYKKPSYHEIVSRQMLLGKSDKKMLLALDLDETLIFTTKILRDIEGIFVIKYWNLVLDTLIRPYALKLLEDAKEYYEIVIFTASSKDYAEAAVKLLDPDRKYISAILSRENCIEMPDGSLIKDLRVIADRPVDKILIADNCIESFAFNLENGIPVDDFFGEEDEELLLLAEYLVELAQSSEPVEYNARKMGFCSQLIYIPEQEGNLIFDTLIRPYALKLLKEVNRYYEIIIFTASSKDYAEAAVKLIDPDKKYISAILSREHCIEMPDGSLIKDLRVIADRPMSKILIADNCIESFAFNMENGIPVDDFFGEDDEELLILAEYLVELAHYSEPVEYNARKMGLFSSIKHFPQAFYMN